MKAEKVKKTTPESMGFRKGTEVFLRSYRNAKGNKEMDQLRISLIGKKAVITGFPMNDDGTIKKDSVGCLLVFVKVFGQKIGNEHFGGHELSWRLSSLRKVHSKKKPK